MSYSKLPADVREFAERALTRKQLDVFKLWCAGVGTARIGIMLDISESTARGHLRRALQKLDLEARRVLDESTAA
jgi:DNA-binding CsgD family transcriptional regulator